MHDADFLQSLQGFIAFQIRQPLSTGSVQELTAVKMRDFSAVISIQVQRVSTAHGKVNAREVKCVTEQKLGESSPAQSSVSIKV